MMNSLSSEVSAMLASDYCPLGRARDRGECVQGKGMHPRVAGMQAVCLQGAGCCRGEMC
jgi:hypothetical protein